MRWLSCAVVALSIVGSSSAVRASNLLLPTPTYAGIPWGTSSAKVKATLASQGYTFLQVGKDGNYSFSGRIGSHNVMVVEQFLPKRGLAESLVAFLTSEEANPAHSALTSFYAEQTALTGTYGQPTKASGLWAGDVSDASPESDLVAAFSAGADQQFAYWDFARGGRVSLAPTDQMDVLVAYESPAWAAAHPRSQSTT